MLKNQKQRGKVKKKSLACKLEYQIKTLTKQQKENLIKGEKISKYLRGKVDCRRYRKYRINIEKNIQIIYNKQVT